MPSFLGAFTHFPNMVSGHRKLVVIQLSGGNDGLNTIVPYRNDIYYRERPSLAIAKEKTIRATDELGFHKSLAPLKQLYDQGYLSVINNVGYPNPDRSHFRSTDIWHTASNADEYWKSGWMGRYVEKFGKNPAQGIEVDDALSVIMKGETMNGIATQNAKLFYGSLRQPYFSRIIDKQTEEHLSEHNLGYLYKTMVDAKSSAKYIYETSKTYSSNQQYPNNPFARQLSTAAQFINSGLETAVYYISMGGFDTHNNQGNRQEKLLSTYAVSIQAFIEDLKKNDTFKDTLVMTFSEFGRRVSENASSGTDHGTANQVFILGQDLKKPGFYNDAPQLLNLHNGDLVHTVDFREIYATLLDKWLQVDDDQVLNRSFSKLDFIV